MFKRRADIIFDERPTKLNEKVNLPKATAYLENEDIEEANLNDSYFNSSDLREINEFESNLDFQGPQSKRQCSSSKQQENVPDNNSSTHSDHASSKPKNSDGLDVYFQEIEEIMGMSTPENVEVALKKGDEILTGEGLFDVLLANARKSTALTSCQQEVVILSSNSNSNCSSPIILPNIDTSFKDLGPFFGLPTNVKNLIKKYKGIEELYDWQKECLNLQAVRSRQNLIYALPTSGGKTLVAEILILRELLCRKKNVLFVFPFVSIVQEKVNSLSPFALELDFLVEEYAGSKGMYPPRRRRWKPVVYVATMEKAKGMVNSLLDESRLSEIGLVVVDELHMIGDSSRGAVLEELLACIMHSQEAIQIVGMSATIGNLQDLALFLKAETYTGDFRPVELEEYVRIENQIFYVNKNSKSSEDILILSKSMQFKSDCSADLRMHDPDRIGSLVLEIIPKNSCLVFCATKVNCEAVAQMICKSFSRKHSEYRLEERRAIYRAIRSEVGDICPVLKRTLPFGVAYHHSGLTMSERNILEEGYREGILCCLCCTSTLAAGVNLPAKRVILRSPYVGSEFISHSQYKQMAGRAGRAGLDSKGESILVSNMADARKVASMMCSQMNDCLSQLNSARMKNLALTSVSLRVASSRKSLHDLLTHTLLYVQAKKLEIDPKELMDQAIQELLEEKVLSVDPDDPLCGRDKETSRKVMPQDINEIPESSKLVISRLGKAAIKGNLSIYEAQQLQKNLLQAQPCLALDTNFHLLYLVTPPDVVCNFQAPESVYNTVYNTLNKKDLNVAYLLGITQSCMLRLMAGQPVRSVSKEVLNRFYVTIVLNELWNKTPMWEVAEKFKLNRGFVQNLMFRSAIYASNIHHFCQELEEFWQFQALLSKFSEQLTHCCSANLLPLMELPAVKWGRAKMMHAAGFKSLQDVAKAHPRDLVEKVEYLHYKEAKTMITTARMLLLEKAESLREEAEEVIEGLAN